MGLKTVLEKHDIEEADLVRFLSQWKQDFFSDIDYFMDEGLILWVCYLLDSAGAVEDHQYSDDAKMNKCVTELAALPEALEERDYGVSRAYTSKCSQCNAVSFLSESDYNLHHSEAHSICFANGCKDAHPEVTSPKGQILKAS
jgi:hypothetical protein